MERGDLVPDEYPIRIIERVIRDNPHVDGYVFKGFPRSLVQAYILDGLLKKIDSQVDVAVEISTSTLTALKRLSGRSKTQKARSYDMNTDVIIHRLEEWKETIKKDVSTFYEAQNKLIHLDGTPSDDEVFETLDSHISKYFK
jgi:adenylate kinase